MVIKVVQPAAKFPRLNLAADAESRPRVQQGRIGSSEVQQRLRKRLREGRVEGHRCEVNEEISHGPESYMRDNLTQYPIKNLSYIIHPSQSLRLKFTLKGVRGSCTAARRRVRSRGPN